MPWRVACPVRELSDPVGRHAHPQRDELLDLPWIRMYVRTMLYDVDDRAAYVARFGVDGAEERAGEAESAFAPVKAALAELLEMAPGPDMAARLAQVQAM